MGAVGPGAVSTMKAERLLEEDQAGSMSRVLLVSVLVLVLLPVLADSGSLGCPAA